jgi:hypothetical protein
MNKVLDFTMGQQPCPNYNPTKDYYDFANIHDCYGPYDGRPKGCSGKVSFCENCHFDHHNNGWDTCGTKHEEKEDGE